MAIELGHLLTLHVEIEAFSVDRIVIVLGRLKVFVKCYCTSKGAIG